MNNRIKVNIGNIYFELNRSADIAALTDVIETITNLEFYENHQLSNEIEVLTFKKRNVKRPIFSSFLTIATNKFTLQFYDMTNQLSWFELKRQNATVIHYSKPSDNGEFITGGIQVKDIRTLKVIINNRATITKRWRQLSLLSINNYDESFYIFQSNMRNQKDELTNTRDGEKMYKLLKELPSLANIEIEKIVVNS